MFKMTFVGKMVNSACTCQASAIWRSLRSMRIVVAPLLSKVAAYVLKNLAMCLRRTCISLESSGDVEDIIVEWFIKLLCEREKGLGVGLQEGFVVASVDGVVGRLREAHGGIRETLDETEEHGHAVEGGGEGDKRPG